MDLLTRMKGTSAHGGLEPWTMKANKASIQQVYVYFRHALWVNGQRAYTWIHAKNYWTASIQPNKLWIPTAPLKRFPLSAVDPSCKEPRPGFRTLSGAELQSLVEWQDGNSNQSSRAAQRASPSPMAAFSVVWTASWRAKAQIKKAFSNHNCCGSRQLWDICQSMSTWPRDHGYTHCRWAVMRWQYMSTISSRTIQADECWLSGWSPWLMDVKVLRSNPVRGTVFEHDQPEICHMHEYVLGSWALSAFPRAYTTSSRDLSHPTNHLYATPFRWKYSISSVSMNTRTGHTITIVIPCWGPRWWSHDSRSLRRFELDTPCIHMSPIIQLGPLCFPA